MAYPERGAGYEHNPKFIERALRAEGGVTQAAKSIPPDLDETYQPPNPQVAFPEPYNHRDREAAYLQTIVPKEPGDKALIHPEDIYDWKSETTPQGT